MMNATYYIERLVAFALEHALVDPMDAPYARNALMDIMHLDAPEACDAPGEALPPTLTPILRGLIDIAVARRLIEDTGDARERLGVRLSGAVTPAPALVRERFRALLSREGAKAATDDFYQMCRASDYIRVDHIAKNVRFDEATEAGVMEITINLSKPEKDPRDIAAALLAPKLCYPKCMLCVENPGYAGRADFPARQNHRIVPVDLAGSRFYMQYSPYLYYPEHLIVLNERHVPMKIDRETFERLIDFVDQFPHYMLGSNADLPIVGGSILSHDHFQGGAHVFPMEKAEADIALDSPDARIAASIVRWPMSCVRLESASAEALIDAATVMLAAWRGYCDEGLGILAHTDQPHNTITPIARRTQGGYVMHLVLRNNRTSDQHPLGIFHPHADLHPVKKENIGLIEVMGLFILPGRLVHELEEIKACLRSGALPAEDSAAYKHAEWIAALQRERREGAAGGDLDALLRRALAAKCARVLCDAGVFKQDASGRQGFMRFMRALGYDKKGD